MNQDFIHTVPIAQIGGKSKSKKERPSPTASATLYKVNTKKTGNDGNTWIVTENKNKIKRWKLLRKKNYQKSKSKTKKKMKSKTKTPKKRGRKVSKMVKTQPMSVLDFYDTKQINNDALQKIIDSSSRDIKTTLNGVTKLIEKLRDLGKIAHIIPLPLSDGGMYWTDYAGDFLNEIYGMDWLDNHMYFTVYLNHDGDEITYREISVNYSTLNKEQKIDLIGLLNEYLPGRYRWRGSNTERIFIDYKKGEENELDISKLKGDDVYPQFYVNIDFNSKVINLFKEDSGLIDDIVKNIKKFSKADFMDHEYGMDDMSIYIYSVDPKKHDVIQNKIEQYFNQMKDDKIVKSYSIDYNTRNE